MFPPITPAGIQRLANQLHLDLAAVMASGASQDLKGKIQTSINDLIGKLLPAAAAGTTDVATSWASTFTTLTGQLREALGAAAATGSCKYSNPPGCIQCTAAQCAALGGTFQPGGSCP